MSSAGRDLEEAALAIFAADDPAALPQSIVDLAIRIMPADNASVLLSGPDGSLRLGYSSSIPPELWSEVTIRLGERIAGRVAASRTPVLVDGQLEGNPEFQDVRSFREHGSSIVYPLVRGERLVGVLCLSRSAQAPRFEPADLARAAVLASQAVLALDNATLVQELRGRIADLERAYARMAESERLAAVGQLAASVSHEINNPLMSVIANNSYVIRELGARADLFGAVPGGEQLCAELLSIAEDSASAVAHIRAVSQDMKTLAQPTRAGPTEIDLDLPVRAAVRLARHCLMDLQVDLALAPGLHVAGSQPKLVQVVLNLIMNAVEAMESRPRHDRRLAVKSGIRHRHCFVSVTDSGPGIAPELLGRIFDPFFSTKPSGNGLGLAISREIVRAHDGDLAVESGPAGTTFTVTIPRLGPAPRERRGAELPEGQPEVDRRALA